VSALLQFHEPGGAPQLREVLATLGLQPADVDDEFGVIPIDPRAGLFAIRVEDGAVERARAALARRPPHPAEGVFSDPRIEPTA
jgi:hypothetical protein